MSRCEVCGGWPEEERGWLIQNPPCTCNEDPTLISQFDITNAISRETGASSAQMFGCLVVLAIATLAVVIAQAGAACC